MNIDEIGRKLLKYPNVTGYSKKLRKRERDGEIIDEWCLQVHVIKKVAEKELRIQDVLPKEVDGIPIDVVVRGELRALRSKTSNIRPLVAGISIGNWAISAGTLGYFVEKTTQPHFGEIFIGSNAHVLADEPKNPTSLIRQIIQPGRHDGGSLADQVAEYYWHKQLHPVGGNSGCSLSRAVVATLNGISKAFGRETRFETRLPSENNIDFAVARIQTTFEFEFFDVEFPIDKFLFAAFGFAGSDEVSCHGKARYTVREGYKPFTYDWAEVEVGDMLHKTGRTSCYTKARVVDDSAFERVNYGNYKVDFDDIILTEHLLDPGDSGSAIWKEVI